MANMRATDETRIDALNKKLVSLSRQNGELKANNRHLKDELATVRRNLKATEETLNGLDALSKQARQQQISLEAERDRAERAEGLKRSYQARIAELASDREAALGLLRIERNRRAVA